jgi:hypothetical protein
LIDQNALDRNVLIDQTMVNDFRPFGGVMAKLSTKLKTIEKFDGTKVDLTLAIEPGNRSQSLGVTMSRKSSLPQDLNLYHWP